MEDKDIVVLCGIIESNGKVLVTQRSKTMAQPLLWEFPGGKLQDSESEEQCLIREIQEELSITVLPYTRLSEVRYTYPDKTIVLIPYICSFQEGTITLLEHEKYIWSEPSALPNYNWCPADIPIVEAYLTRLLG